MVRVRLGEGTGHMQHRWSGESSYKVPPDTPVEIIISFPRNEVPELTTNARAKSLSVVSGGHGCRPSG